jgi:hypothetical protein
MGEAAPTSWRGGLRRRSNFHACGARFLVFSPDRPWLLGPLRRHFEYLRGAPCSCPLTRRNRQTDVADWRPIAQRTGLPADPLRDHACFRASSGRPQLNNRPSVRTTASAKKAAVSIKNSRSRFRLITIIPLGAYAAGRRRSETSIDRHGRPLPRASIAPTTDIEQTPGRGQRLLR